MTPKELIRLLKEAGFELDRHGSRHDLYRHPETGIKIQVERHNKDIAAGTLNKILKDAGLK